MECIHLVHPKKYDAVAHNWSRVAFRNNGGSLSVFTTGCIDQFGLPTCEHLPKYWGAYEHVCSEPPVFWRFDTDDLPNGWTVELDGPEEECHFVIQGLDDGQLWTVFANPPINELSICHNGDIHPLTEVDILKIQAEYRAKFKKK